MPTESDQTPNLQTLLESLEFDGLFFPGAGRKKAVDSLLHFARYGSMLLFLRGPEGSGRSSVLNEFANTVDRDTQVVLLREPSAKPLDYLADSVDRLGAEVSKLVNEVSSLELAAADSESAGPDGLAQDAPMVESAQSRLTRYIRRLGARGRRLVVIFDDQVEFAERELGQLIDIAEKNDGVVKLVFSGDERLAERIVGLTERDSVLVNFIDLPALSTQDALAYLDYRMQALGYRGAQPFRESQVASALERSAGNLNHFHRLLGDLPLPPLDQPRGLALPLPHIVAAVSLLFIIAMLWFTGGEPPANVVDPEPIVLEKLSEPKAAIAANTGSGSDADDADVAVEVAVDVEPEKTATAVLAAASNEPAGPAAAAIELAEPSELSRGTRVASSASERESVATTAVRSEAKPSTSSSTKPVTKPVTQAVTTPAAKPATAPVTEPVAKSATGPAVKAQSQPATTTNAAPNTNSGSSSARVATAVHKRLLGWPATGYALQVFGTHNAARAEEMVGDYFGEADLVFYETRHNNKPWFVVITGPYSGSEAARQGISELPDGLRGLRPWPRNIASIHRDLQRYHGL